MAMFLRFLRASAEAPLPPTPVGTTTLTYDGVALTFNGVALTFSP